MAWREIRLYSPQAGHSPLVDIFSGYIYESEYSGLKILGAPALEDFKQLHRIERFSVFLETSAAVGNRQLWFGIVLDSDGGSFDANMGSWETVDIPASTEALIVGCPAGSLTDIVTTSDYTVCHIDWKPEAQILKGDDFLGFELRNSLAGDKWRVGAQFRYMNRLLGMVK